ncbi:multiheme c-type cytochrome [Candidatus Hydrogenedentota bacterium]
MRARVILGGIVVLSILGVAVSPAVSYGVEAKKEESSKKREYIGASKCKVCHNKKSTGKQYEAWSKLKHANAHKTLLTEKAVEVAKKQGVSGAPSEAPECLRCHVTSYDVEKKAVPKKIKMKDGVQCESCHGPNSLHQDAAKKQMKAKGAAKEAIDVTSSLVKPEEAMCKKCHNKESPTFDGKFDFKEAVKKVSHPNPKKKKK